MVYHFTSCAYVPFNLENRQSLRTGGFVIFGTHFELPFFIDLS